MENASLPNPLETIENEMAKQRPTTIGFLKGMSANETIKQALATPTPKDLYDGIIFENSMICIFADTGIGKSTFAVLIGAHIAESQPVVYFDFELNDKQFQLRYTCTDGETFHTFPKAFIRFGMNEEAEIDYSTDFPHEILENIKAAAESFEAKVLIIDNITYLCPNTEKSELAANFMKELRQLKNRGYTIIVLAHTPKLPMFRPLSDCDLAGSRQLSNFFDTIIAMGRSTQGEDLRYIKQVKGNRTGATKYGADNVLVCRLCKETSGALWLERLKTDREKAHIKLKKEDKQSVRESVVAFHQNGYSCREISKETGLSKSEVNRIIKKSSENEQTSLFS